MRVTTASCVMAAFVLAGAPSRAATHVWNPAVTSGNWSSAGSWSMGGVPTSGEGGGTIVQIGGGVSATDDIAGLVIDQLVFTSGGNTVNGGVTLGINGALIIANLRNITGSNTIGPSLAIALSGSTLGIETDAGTLTVSASISGSFGVTMVSGSAAGTLTLAGPNSYGGGTIVTEGTMILSAIAINAAVPKNLTVGNGSGAAASAVVHQTLSEEIANASVVTVNSDGRLVLDATETVASVVMTGGSVIGAGTLKVSGAGGISSTSDGNGVAASIATSGLDLGGFTTIFSIGQGPGTIDLDVSAAVVNGGLQKEGSGTLQVSGSTANTTAQTTFVNDGTLILNKTPGVNAIAGPLAVGVGLASPLGTLRLAADNQIADTVDVTVFSAGILDLAGHSDAIHALQLRTNTTNAAQVATGAGTLTLGGDLSLIANGTGAVGATLSGNLALGGAPRNFTIGDGAAAVDLNLSAVISGAPVGLVKAGAGTVRLSANSSYTGPTAVVGGALVVDGALPGAVTVSSGMPGVGILGGLGTVAGISASTGVVSPGDSPGILSSSLGVTFQAGSSFDVEIVGTIAGFQYDRLNVTGNATLAGTLNVALGYTPVLGDSFTILTTTGTVTGTFAGLPEGALIVSGGDALQIHYASNAVVLTVSCTGPDSTNPVVAAPAAATVTETVCQ